MESEKNYLDFAEDDCKYLDEDYKRGRVANYMASMAQNICERYLKHIIDKYAEVHNDDEERKKQDFLHKHSLNALIQYIQKNTTMEITKEDRQTIREADGYYFSTRYPGDETIEVDKEMIDECMTAVYRCREKVLEYCREQELEQQKKYLKSTKKLNDHEKSLDQIIEEAKLQVQISNQKHQISKEPVRDDRELHEI